MTRTPPPGAARARLDREMRVLFAVPQNGQKTLDLTQVYILTYRPGEDLNVWTPPSAAERPAPRPVAARFRWAAAQLATALLVLIAVGLGSRVVGPGGVIRSPGDHCRKRSSAAVVSLSLRQAGYRVPGALWAWRGVVALG